MIRNEKKDKMKTRNVKKAKKMIKTGKLDCHMT